ncbi:hypothetical protein ONE63_007189 [Megalurothrips usitatus]|uniref:2-oxoglutarate and iron-dependent oxygenase JMJD4 n=1 Tax=Megalurothrips usitatus TaxID=439358 RepID=A0AAV7XR94_9NEOP|nr:hypothetical protein ONE63_007189 [Megalurothrips usitatus]
MHEIEIEINNSNHVPIVVDYEDTITTINTEISYQDFFENFLLCNRPCLIREFITCQWPCRSLWTEGSKPNLSYLQEEFGDAEVPVANCNEKEYNSQKKETQSLYKYIDYLKDYINDGHPSSTPNLYLKDWHLTRDYPNAHVYRVLKYFSCDWLNEYFSSRSDLNDDYRFVYIGPKGSWTPFHADVFSSYSWSVNVIGRKRWILFPPGEQIHLKDKFGNLAYDILSDDVHDKSLYPLCDKPGKFYDIIQEPGEAIFVPSGWHHQVWNLEDTISINHNWVNGCNIEHIWSALSSCLSQVQKEVDDCRDMDDWHAHCQLMLRATHGLHFEEFFDLLQCIAEPRIMQIKGYGKVKMFGDWELGSTHAMWDLHRISKTLNIFLKDENLTKLSWVAEKKPHELKRKIDVLLESMKYSI